ncbi:carbamoyltransferase HypF [Nostoc spongiaeforme FACHB-130]|uniref:Carbamoyltransferase n=1 Tax=Nostoc spongiaeforme FACHB-130 TaxID=1357510 RepID=A0ABR8G380_9NOSO|nr:carbamoyltransferase HypF [Nostoc spongiaeforme]MBD2597651.1 carbamoyltransferase HypF [Nostoc spongiaeforme FACHB-130]
MVSEEIRVRGTVQGVGFRPTVYRLAKACGLRGDVCNDGEGVLIRVSGSEEAITEFVVRLQQECPPLAKIQELVRTRCTEELNGDDFVISPSVSNKIKTDITPDAATCPQCQKEIFDPFSRFYRYPFTNCTHCGPRLSIIRAIPYDRCNTSMSAFVMCGECAAEYHDVENRRFHAQPTACHSCGPSAWLERADGKPVTASMFSMMDDVDAVCTLLQKGEIVAIKGLGGFHLACDATNEVAVQKLRQRKRRYDKPFALMARDLAVIEEYCIVGEKEKELLVSSAAPVVLLRRKEETNRQGREGRKGEEGRGVKEGLSLSSVNNNRSTQHSALSTQHSIAESVAPGQNTLGFMLPYTPLHHLILRRMNRPIVLTSGNISDEPQCIDNDTALEKLGKIADYFLLHNRDIVNRIDDSVVRVVGEQIQIIRRARGYAPAPIKLPPGFEQVAPILAMGSELKNTFCLLRDGEAILSQHLGDLENAAAFNAYQETLNLYLNLFEHKPEAIAIDKHPEYLSSKLGKELATANQIPLHQIQHHHAHIAACMAENGIPLNTSPVLGIAFDGLGYGEDGTLWGGEFLLADYRQFQRLATFKPVAMIGGEQAIYQPWRNTYAHLISANLWEQCQSKYTDLEILKFLGKKPLQLLNQVIEKNINSPPASSVGRLFDAVAAAIGICTEECSYEGQAAIALESLVDVNILNNHKEKLIYPFNFNFSDNIYCIDSAPMWSALLSDLQQQIPQSVIAAKFHQSLAHITVKMVKLLCQEYQIQQVVLTGGVFQNTILLQLVTQQLQASNINVLTHSLVPTNDGGLSLGQAIITAARLITNY